MDFIDSKNNAGRLVTFRLSDKSDRTEVTVKLFDGFEAVRFPEENMIFVTQDGYLYYIYNHKYKHWKKHINAGNDTITVSNYQDVSRKELEDAMQGVFPEKATDFMRLCNPEELWLVDLLALLREDYAVYMSDNSISYAVNHFLYESDLRHTSFKKLKKMFDDDLASGRDNRQVLGDIKELSFAVIGRDIYKKEIGIIDGHNGSSYFWIMPVRVVDCIDTNNPNNIAEMRSVEISIEEEDVSQYLAPFLYKHFDSELEANKLRIDADDFEWYLTYNFFTFDSVTDILNDIKDTVDALSSGRENEFTAKIKGEYGAENELILNFYQRFIYRMEYMMRVGKENGFDLISFMGP